MGCYQEMNEVGIKYKIYRRCCYLFRKMQVKVSKKSYALNQEVREKRIIVSMTSYPARFSNIHLTLKSLMLQTMKPDKIIVWLDEDVERAQYTKRMINLEQYGIEYQPISGNLMPHKKYLHAMQAYPDDIIITVDDDLIYSSDLIASLMRTHKQYPKAVCARRLHQMKKDADGNIMPYNDWQGEYTQSRVPAHDLLATGVGGVLYPPHCLDSRAFDTELIERLCLKADDIWLKFMELLVGTKVVWAACAIPMPQVIEKSQKTSLKTENVQQNKNDIYFRNVAEYFQIEGKRFWE